MNDVQRPDDRPGPASGQPPRSQLAPPPTGPFAPPPGRPYPPAPRRRSGWKVVGIVAAVLVGIPAVLLLVGMIAVAARGDAPSAPAAASPLASSTVTDVKAGDCFDSAPVPADGSSTSVAAVDKIPCTQPHTQQAVATTSYPGGWSGVQNDAEQACAKAFRGKVPATVLSGGRHVPAIMHADLASSTFVVCVMATDKPTSGSVMK